MRLTDWQPRSTRVVQIVLIVSAMFTVGCYKAMGGGWIPSAPGADKATFGFSAPCKTTKQNGLTVALLYDGQLEWKDGVVGFHAVIDPLPIVGPKCETIRQFTSGQAVTFSGTYTPQPAGAPGTFSAVVIDNGEPGTISGDYIEIHLMGGQYAGYVNFGTIQGGNIQVF